MATNKKPVPAPHKQQPPVKKAVEPSAQPKTQTTAHTSRYKAASTGSTLDFAFGRINYIIMLVGLVFLAIGFILMVGGGSNDPKVFNENIFDAQRLTISPILILLGFAIEIVAILKKPRN